MGTLVNLHADRFSPGNSILVFNSDDGGEYPRDLLFSCRGDVYFI